MLAMSPSLTGAQLYRGVYGKAKPNAGFIWTPARTSTADSRCRLLEKPGKAMIFFSAMAACFTAIC
jgi:hypothetical protein